MKIRKSGGIPLPSKVKTQLLVRKKPKYSNHERTGSWRQVRATVLFPFAFLAAETHSYQTLLPFVSDCQTTTFFFFLNQFLSPCPLYPSFSFPSPLAWLPPCFSCTPHPAPHRCCSILALHLSLPPEPAQDTSRSTHSREDHCQRQQQYVCAPCPQWACTLVSSPCYHILTAVTTFPASLKAFTPSTLLLRNSQCTQLANGPTGKASWSAGASCKSSNIATTP